MSHLRIAVGPEVLDRALALATEGKRVGIVCHNMREPQDWFDEAMRREISQNATKIRRTPTQRSIEFGSGGIIRFMIPSRVRGCAFDVLVLSDHLTSEQKEDCLPSIKTAVDPIVIHACDSDD